MKILNLIKKIIYSSAFVFTTTVFVFCFVFSFFMDDPSLANSKAIPISSYPWLLLFSVIVASLNHLLSSKLLPLFPRLLIHFAGVMTSIYFVFLSALHLGQTNHGKLSVMVVFSVIYVVVMLLVLFVRTAFLRVVGALTDKKASSAELSETNEEDEDTSTLQ